MKHRALIVGAGRIGAGFNWHDDAYTHAGAYRALPDRVELVGFVEPDAGRALTATAKWNVPAADGLESALTATSPDIVSICTQPDDQYAAIIACLKAGVRGIWCEKPYHGPRVDVGIPIMVNYMRRGDPLHQRFLDANLNDYRLVVYGKDDIHTRCHFEDLAKWWGVPLEYHAVNKPCRYILTDDIEPFTFENGGVDGGICFKAMLTNLLDHVDDPSIPLWSHAT